MKNDQVNTHIEVSVADWNRLWPVAKANYAVEWKKFYDLIQADKTWARSPTPHIEDLENIAKVIRNISQTAIKLSPRDAYALAHWFEYRSTP